LFEIEASSRLRQSLGQRTRLPMLHGLANNG
jgi:hypothetical protein